MTTRVGTTVQNERDDDGTGPTEAYLMPHPTIANRFILGTGTKSEAAAFLKHQGSGKYTLDDDPAEEDRQLYKTTSTRVLV
jgi:hypothetical protein